MWNPEPGGADVLHAQTTILLVDGVRLFREAMKTLIGSWPGLVIAGEAATVKEARAALDVAAVDVVLLDIDLPAEPGFSLLRYLAGEQRKERAVVLTRELHPDYIRESLRLGACGYLSHGIGPDRLRDALHAARDGGVVMDPPVCKALADDPVRDPITDRECEVLTLIAQGACNAAIAEQLGITEKTVKSHVSSLLGKLGMTSRVHLAVYAQGTQLLDAPSAERVRGIAG